MHPAWDRDGGLDDEPLTSWRWHYAGAPRHDRRCQRCGGRLDGRMTALRFGYVMHPRCANFKDRQWRNRTGQC